MFYILMVSPAFQAVIDFYSFQLKLGIQQVYEDSIIMPPLFDISYIVAAFRSRKFSCGVMSSNVSGKLEISIHALQKSILF